MSERTYQITLPSGLAEALVATLEQVLKEAGFQETLKAGEVGGVETDIWQREKAQVVITFRETETEEKVTIWSQGTDGAAIVKAAACRLVLKLLEALPPEICQTLEPAVTQLRELAALAKDLSTD
ncbi:hypothetical protein Q2T83_09745 [Fervidibacter sacchari]|uniref:Uncharacterized protein n=1 Tax=Candidatus Fervidibacter sacchari TaxID=1448929 RepID=A0ABT2ER40_9BACT|nr:hypothetical protein [Candidatus Fervidibacter sacchari]MCS3920419.1 hypothetical protein [Candidatus Fervidibacter sacchari]WKU14621.1 hypothetical protein Q2T83_09745 [Candidatus Fervidibacter sacchari]